MNKYKFKFSVIIPIYNVEKYLEGTIISVIKQSIGFKENIQIILINDGSPDNSEEICLKYVKKFPNNIIYKKIANSGVSVARNEGLKYIDGEFINFLDSDDKWGRDVFKKVYKMFENNDDLNIIGVRQKLFEKYNGYSSLDFKFDKDKVVDLSKDYNHIQLSVSSGFIRSSKVGKIRFDKNVKYSEDAKFIYDYMIENNIVKLGIISSSLYYYRKRYDENSAIQTKNTKLDWYKETVKLSYLYLLEKAKKLNSPLYKTICYYVAYDYQWRITYNLLVNTSFNEKDIQEYYDDTKKIFSFIDCKIILEQKNLETFYKNYILNLMYHKPEESLNIILNSDLPKELNIKTNKYEDNKLILEGSLDYIYTDKIKLYYEINGKSQEIYTNIDYISKYKNMFNDSLNGIYFKVIIYLKVNDKIKFYFKLNNKKYYLNLKFDFWSNLSNHNKSYYKFDSYIIYNKKSYLLVKKSNFIRHISSRLLLDLSLIKHKHLKVLCYRLLCYIYKIFYIKPIWIISDREMIAGDNGEALFKYINSINDRKHNIYFVIDKKSKSVDNLKEIGKILYFNTYRYKIMFMLSNCIISSHADPYVYNPFGKSYKFFKDLFHHKYIFLQHGITRHDMSDWLNKFNLNFSMFVVTNEKEYNLILNNKKCGYDEDVLKVTGLSRYDYLINKESNENVIMLAPTWRPNLVGHSVFNLQERKYNSSFKNSDFCKFYNKLFSDKELISILDKYNYKIHCCFHPSLKNQLIDFKIDNKEFEIIKNINYNNEFCKCKLLITDYSSVVFDCAYLKKPVIYNIFDIDTFYKSHIYNQGNYDFEKEGFGEVAHSYDELKKLIIDYIKNDCKIKQKYLDRINNYFYFHDRNNSKRIYEEILKIEKR